MYVGDARIEERFWEYYDKWFQQQIAAINARDDDAPGKLGLLSIRCLMNRELYFAEPETVIAYANRYGETLFVNMNDDPTKNFDYYEFNYKGVRVYALGAKADRKRLEEIYGGNSGGAEPAEPANGNVEEDTAWAG